MKVHGKSPLQITAPIFVLYLTQSSLANLCLMGYTFPEECYGELKNNKCTYAAGTCRQPVCGDTCFDERQCFGAYYNDSCTNCDAITTKCVKPKFGTPCNYDESCSGADDGCTKCDLDGGMSSYFSCGVHYFICFCLTIHILACSFHLNSSQKIFLHKDGTCMQPACGDNCTSDMVCKGTVSCTKCGKFRADSLSEGF